MICAEESCRWAKKILLGVCFLVLSSGCMAAPVPVLDTRPILPPPEVHIVTSTPVDASTLEAGNPTASPDAQSFPDTLLGLAESVYGDRLIQRIRIRKIGVNAPVVPVGWQPDAEAGETITWDAPGAQVGWVVSSGLPPDEHNMIFYGHNNLDSSVFQRLADLQPGDQIQLISHQTEWSYKVRDVVIIPDITQAQDRAAYNQYFQAGNQALLTLISCWPPESNTHRVIILADPVNETKNQ